MHQETNEVVGADGRSEEVGGETLLEELKHLGHQLNRLVNRSNGQTEFLSKFFIGGDAVQIHQYLRLRASRAQFFGAGLFSDPAWEILLDLYASALTGGRVSVSSACLASGAPMTTGLRWLAVLESRKLVEREKDSKDGRRVYVKLTAEASAAMERYLNAASGCRI